MRRIASEIKPPVSCNMIEGGKTPLLSLEEIKEMGFAGVGYPLTGVYSAARAVEAAFAHLIERGSTLAITDRMMQFDEFVGVVGLEEKYRLDAKYSAKRG